MCNHAVAILLNKGKKIIALDKNPVSWVLI